MLDTRWKKPLRDLWVNKTRTLLVVFSIAVGIAGVGSILTSLSILTREMDRNYMETNPASAIFYMEGVDNELVQSIQARPEIAEAEARRTVVARYQMGSNAWMSIHLFVIDDFDHLRVSTFTSERGDWNPESDEILIERSALRLIQQDTGDDAIIKTAGGIPQSFRITGIVHDPGQAPSWMEGFAYGYITVDGLARLGEAPVFNELQVVMAGNVLEQDANRHTAKNLRTWLDSEGYKISRVQIPVPGEHPHNDQMMTLLFILETFGILALLLSGMLVATMMSALIEQQIRQIGVMKTVGACQTQVAKIYLGKVVILGLLALVIGIPLGLLGGRAYADFAAATLNFNIASYRVDGWVFMVQIAAALLIPVIGAAFPVYKGSRITIREAISTSGVSINAIGTRSIDQLLGRVQGLGRTLLLSLRNTFRRMDRLMLVLISLAVAGAVFMVAVNVGASWNKTVEAEFESRGFDAMLRLKQPYPIEQLTATFSDVREVIDVETWVEAKQSLVYLDGDNSDPFQMIGLPPETQMLSLPLMEGRWLRPEDTNALVVSHMLLDQEPSLSVGSQVNIEFNGQAAKWVVVGVVRQIGPNIAYANQDYFTSLIGLERKTNIVTAVTNNHSATGQAKSLQALEAALLNADVGVTTAGTSQEGRQVLVDHLYIIVTLLMIMAFLVAAVSGMGLASTMSLNVMERQREIGVMRAVGAKAIQVLQITLGEGIFIGLLSWGLAILLSFPLTNIIGNITGNLFIEAPLVIVYSGSGIGIWLGIILVLTAIASSLPAVKASEMPVHEVLAYE